LKPARIDAIPDIMRRNPAHIIAAPTLALEGLEGMKISPHHG
jgi:hypothetical protein